MKAVITGSGGFIGSHLVSAVTLMGIQVIPIHRDLLYSAPDLKAFFTKENQIGRAHV
jgi:nucleoside-diphosphate-sugar epimerase